MRINFQLEVHFFFLAIARNPSRSWLRSTSFDDIVRLRERKTAQKARLCSWIGWMFSSKLLNKYDRQSVTRCVRRIEIEGLGGWSHS